VQETGGSTRFERTTVKLAAMMQVDFDQEKRRRNCGEAGSNGVQMFGLCVEGSTGGATVFQS